MDPALAIGLVVVVAAFLGWWLWASRRRRGNRAGGAASTPRDAWQALDHGIDPSELDDEAGPAGGHDGAGAPPSPDADTR